MICVNESDLPEPARDCNAANMHRDFETGICVCNEAYIYDESRGGCRKNWKHKCQAPEVWVDQFGACHCPNAPNGVIQVLKNGKCDTLLSA